MQQSPLQAPDNDLQAAANALFIAICDIPLFHKRLYKFHLGINSFVFRLLAFPFAIAHRGDASSAFFCWSFNEPAAV
ncbi:hypothetical protein, partial [Klebsiella pneumoniae]|uniref:hypothetical protein n=1 Tax=Klebsiella pneumoniae TaxID=573 RepID=UPI001D0E2B00